MIRSGSGVVNSDITGLCKKGIFFFVFSFNADRPFRSIRPGLFSSDHVQTLYVKY